MANYIDKLKQLDSQLDNPTIHQQVLEISKIIATVDQQEILPVAPKAIGLKPDAFEDVLLAIGKNKKDELTAINHLFNGLRQFLSLKFGIWSLPNLATANLIKEQLHIKTALEVMAGNGYWSKALEEVGIHAVATDSLEWAKTSKTGSTAFVPVKDLDAVSAIKYFPDFDLILCSWSPNFGKNDLELIKAWKKYSNHSHLLFIGEKDGATNSTEFWNEVKFQKSVALTKINHSFLSYDFIDEKIYEIAGQ